MQARSTDTHAAIYCRISRDAEGDGEGVERQERLCRELATRLGLNVVDVYTDNDIGASDRTSTTKQRDAYARLIKDARSGRFHHILAYSNSRLTRRMLELEDLIQLHEQSDVIIHTVASGDDDLSTSDGRMVARIKASVDAAESDRIAERQKAAFLHNALQGKPKLQHQRAFGWERDGITVNPEEAALIRAGVERLKQGESVTTIARDWERQGIKTAAGKDEWPWQTLHRVLVGWRTAGVRTYKREPLRDSTGELVMGTWEPIISLKDREDALAMLRKRGLKKVRQGKWYLSGMVKCGVCGGKMYGQLGKTRTYTCKPGKGHNVITADTLESEVQWEVINHYVDRRTQGRDKDAAPQQDEEWPKQNELDAANAKIEELMTAYHSNELPSSVAFPMIDTQEQIRQQLRKERDDFLAQRAEPKTPLDLETWYDKFLLEEMAAIVPNEEPDSFDRKTLAMRQVVETVIVKKGLRGRAGWGDAGAKRIEIVWRG
ncbi:Site-specific DNA recombinase [Brevibacterium iodinum ATCC 49514]|uniref:Site-specific DNA recombinase n=1 Tax=Brevibacterium iodinum ATCC 49514 TaxID=1255616 RepID=A0A2H1JTL3_9MICO|nr:recombinase family protein [Brevibacterium iodinum]SMX90664.1 Site-specific DNA recombinase [Brevibacterium iodinum ATCC 49514]SUW12430.1 Resolvase, N terminal domain [Brevibacterium iodinum]